MSHRVLTAATLAAVLLAAVSSAHASKLYVATNGVDTQVPACGGKAQPCRSISFALKFATAADSIIVGPGLYGEIDRDGLLGGFGEEFPAVPCNCMLAIDKAVTITSTDGAAATLLSPRNATVAATVRILANGAVFGKAGKGFTIAPADAGGSGVVIAASNVAVRGHDIVSDRAAGNLGVEVIAGAGPAAIENNRITGSWGTGISAFGATALTIRTNQVMRAGLTGIDVRGSALISGNILLGNRFGLTVGGAAVTTGNGIYGNYEDGVLLLTDATGSVRKNNIFGNVSCGLTNLGVVGLPAENNFWGAATGPGLDPADPIDGICLKGAATTFAVPFATKPFKVKP